MKDERNWIVLLGPGLDALQRVAERHGLKGKLRIEMLPATRENIRWHCDASKGKTVYAIYHDGRILFQPFMWRKMLKREGLEAVARDMGVVITEEIGHQLDFERIPNWMGWILDFPHNLTKAALNSSEHLPHSAQGIIKKLYWFFYERSIFEKRAKAYANAHWQEYYQAFQPYFEQYAKEYTNLSTAD